MDLTVIAERLGMPLASFSSFPRNPKLLRHKPAGYRPDKTRGLARCSDDRQGKEKSVGDQVDEIIRVALRYGKQKDTYPIHVDNSKSASDWGVYRKEWEELCAAVAHFGAVDMVIVWAVNRLSRLSAEGKHFMWLCWINDVHVLIIKDYLEDIQDGGDGSRGEKNMRRRSDWDAMEQAFKDAEKESQGKSQDIARGHAGNRRKGRLGGQPPAGWIRKYDPVTREPHHEVELQRAAVLVRELKEMAGGTSPSMIAWMLNQDGIAPFTPVKKDGTRRNRWGKWSARAVVVTALNPIHIGKICRKPLGLDKQRDLTDLADATDYFPIVRGPVKDGEWTPEQREILGWHGTEQEWTDLWYAARDKYLLSRGSVFNISKVRPGGSTHLLSFIAICGVCGGPLRLATYTRKSGCNYTYLTCEKSGHVAVREDWASEYADELVTGKLSRLITDGGYRAEEPGKLAELMKNKEDTAGYWDDMIAYYKNDAKDAKATITAEKDKAAALEELDAVIRTLRIPVVIRSFIDTGGDPGLVAVRWAGKDVSARRADLKALTASITVARSPLGRSEALRVTEEERRQVACGQVSIEWAEEYRQAGDSCQAAEAASIAILEVPDGHKLCTACRVPELADEEHFYKVKDGLSNVCKRCQCARQRRYKAERRDQARAADSGAPVAVTEGAA